MSKRKDRLYTEYRHCPICGAKYMWVKETKKLFHKKRTYIHCGSCGSCVQVRRMSKL